MVGPLGVGLLARDVEKEVSGEGEDLLANEVEECVDGGISKIVLPVDLVVVALGNTEVGASLGDINLVLLHGGMVRMMAMVRDSPGEVGSPHEGVGDETDNVADGSVGREGTMTSLVSDDPDTRKVQALEPPVHAPETPSKDLGTNGRKSVADELGLSERIDKGGEVPEHSGDDKVARHVEETFGGVTNEEFGGDGGADLA